jgi:hypothetical protein
MAMAAALFTAPASAVARSCILPNTATQKACQANCCANKTCCATPKNTTPPSQPLAKAGSSQQLNAIGLATALSLSGHTAEAAQFRLEATPPSAHVPPRLALLCTLLI